MKLKGKHIVFSIFTVIALYSFTVKFTTPIYFETPKNWEKPVYDFSKNPLTEEGFQLGKKLFYDPIISRDNTIS